jgi:thioredoxin reductase (NADPH)
MYEIAIIGAGPAGASAAIFTGRAEKKTLVFDLGESIAKKAWFDNYYGIDEISGPELYQKGKQQLQNVGAELKVEKVMSIKKEATGFLIETTEASYLAKQIILATGFATDLAERMGIEMIAGIEPKIPKVVKVDATGKTNINGIWAAGIIAGNTNHAVVVAGDGAKVAINIVSEINGQRYVDHELDKK